MDDIVLRSIAKWPNVPSVYGWLELDRRGRWRIKGEHIIHPGLNEFIARNYTHDETGQWYFQNGPQRVYVRIAYLPYVMRVAQCSDGFRLFTHTGREIPPPDHAWIDEQGNFVVGFEGIAGLISDQDLEAILPWIRNAEGASVSDEALSDAIEEARLGATPRLTLHYGPDRLPIATLRSEEAPRRFRFAADPRPAPGVPEC